MVTPVDQRLQTIGEFLFIFNGPASQVDDKTQIYAPVATSPDPDITRMDPVSRQSPANQPANQGWKPAQDVEHTIIDPRRPPSRTSLFFTALWKRIAGISSRTWLKSGIFLLTLALLALTLLFIPKCCDTPEKAESAVIVHAPKKDSIQTFLIISTPEKDTVSTREAFETSITLSPVPPANYDIEFFDGDRKLPVTMDKKALFKTTNKQPGRVKYKIRVAINNPETNGEKGVYQDIRVHGNIA